VNQVPNYLIHGFVLTIRMKAGPTEAVASHAAMYYGIDALPHRSASDPSVDRTIKLFLNSPPGRSRTCWQQIDLSGFVAHELSALCKAEETAEGVWP
jgi:hypothetical protein